MDRFASVTAFVRVVESGGFSAAGRRLNLSKATVSDQVQALENALGVRLLNRYHPAGQSDRDRPRLLRAVRTDPARPGGGRRGRRSANRQPRAASFASIAIKTCAVRRTGRHRLSSPVPGSVGRSAHQPRDDRPRRGGVRPGDQPVPAPDATLVRRRLATLSLYVVLRPGLSRKTSGAAIPGRPRRPQLPTLPLRTARGRVALSGCRWQSGGGAHIGKPDQQQPRNHPRRRRGRHWPGD